MTFVVKHCIDRLAWFAVMEMPSFDMAGLPEVHEHWRASTEVMLCVSSRNWTRRFPCINHVILLGNSKSRLPCTVSLSQWSSFQWIEQCTMCCSPWCLHGSGALSRVVSCSYETNHAEMVLANSWWAYPIGPNSHALRSRHPMHWFLPFGGYLPVKQNTETTIQLLWTSKEQAPQRGSRCQSLRIVRNFICKLYSHFTDVTYEVTQLQWMMRT